jgi:UDP-N-acetylglucosamine diphosphorylase/glucosamine-1-phosphate N-acetyltransferase
LKEGAWQAGTLFSGDATMNPGIGIIVLAAGLGTRMKSNKAKVLHEICGQPMIYYVVKAAENLAGSNVFVVVGHQAEKVEAVVGKDFKVSFALQPEQLGTGHAVLCAMPELGPDIRDVVILCGDVPLIKPETIGELIADHKRNRRAVTLFAVAVENPSGYGRVLFNDNKELIAIVEEADASDEQKAVQIINTGIYVIERDFLANALPELKADNSQKEIYLTDIIAIGHRKHKNMGVVIGKDPDEIIGVNSPNELQHVEKIMEKRVC